jgi:hypothetical protein
MFVNVTVILTNDPPQIINLSDFAFTNDQTYVINLDTCVIDNDHKQNSMIWKITTSDENLSVNIDNRIANFNVTNWWGEPDVTFTVTDPDGASDSITVKCSILPTSIENFDILIPNEFFLKQNYPNPFNPKTIISFGLPKPAEVKIIIFNLSGQLVAEILCEKKQAGNYSILWDASDISAGTYFIKMVAGDFINIKKCILLK